jgi:trk system potassium uptake protein
VLSPSAVRSCFAGHVRSAPTPWGPWQAGCQGNLPVRSGDSGQSCTVGRAIGRRLVIGYITVVGVGAALLALLPSTLDGAMGVLDAVFTAASAVTLTGLSVRSATEMRLAGEIVVFALMTFGAVGVAAVTSGLVLAIRRGGWSDRQMLTADLGTGQNEHLRLVRFVLVTVAALTGLGGVAFTFAGLGAWDATFHALSSFANGGFSTLDNGLADAGTVGAVTACVLVTVGGIGYPVTFEIVERFRGRRRRLSVTGRMVVVGTGVLAAAGAVLFALSEWTNPATLGGRPVGERLAALATLTVMPRSAGLSVVDLDALGGVAFIFTMVLMFIGAGPAATAGGIKITGATVLALAVWSAMRGRDRVGTRRTTIATQSVMLAAGCASVLAVTVVVCAMVLAGGGAGVDVALFNAVSAVTTTGLSVGDGTMNAASRVALTAGMLIGRLAPMYLAARLLTARRPDVLAPDSRPLIT